MRLVSQLSGEELAISLITVQELYAGRSSREHEKEKDMLAVISPLKMLPITYQIVKTAGCVARDFDKRAMTMADALIAATCLEYEAELATLNERDFAMIPRLRLRVELFLRLNGRMPTAGEASELFEIQ